MRFWFLLLFLVPVAFAEDPTPQPDSKVIVPQKKVSNRRASSIDVNSAQQAATPQATPAQGESSSKDTQVDLTAPPDDARMHPDSEIPDDVHEMKPWNPHKAEKNIEVGEYYFKQKNYPAAESRFREALEYKPDDALATFRLAETLDKLGRETEAAQNYRAYLKTLPNGPYADDCRKALERFDKASAR